MPRPELEDLIAEFVERCDLGEGLDPAAFARAHPEVEAELSAALQRLGEVDALFPEHTGDGERVIGPYRVLGPLGRGGTGHVLCVEHAQRPGETLALKVLSLAASWNPRAVERLEREGRALQRVAHPSVVRIVDIGTSAGTPYLVMELVAGQSLASLLDEARAESRPVVLPGDAPLALAAARLVAQVARAVHAAHVAGLLHRDVKPSNILLRASGAPVLIDFGLAGGDAGDTLTATGDVLGTPQYMAPEQAAGATVGPAADVWGLGAVLYELLTLHPPHEGGDTASVLAAVRTRPVVRVRRRLPGAPQALETIVRKALAWSPRRRHASAAALADDLEAFAAGRPIAARPPGPLERLADAWRFHARAIAAGAAVILLAAALLLALSGRRGDSRMLAQKARAEAAHAWIAGDLPRLRAAGLSLAELDPRSELPRVLAALADEREPAELRDPACRALAEGARLVRDKKWPDALAALERAAALVPDDPMPIVMRGVAALRGNQREVAITELTAASRLLPPSAALQRELGRAYRGERRFAESEKALLLALSLAPDDARAWHDLARTRDAAENEKPPAQRDHAAALAAAERACELAGKDASDEILRARATLLDRCKRAAESEPIWRQLLARDPASHRDRMQLAANLDTQHRMVEAKAEYERLCSAMPDNPRVPLSIAYLLAGSDPSCEKCRDFFAAHPELLDADAAERHMLAAARLDAGRDQGSVSAIVDIARRIGRKESAARVLAEILEQATAAGDDARIARLSKAVHALRRP